MLRWILLSLCLWALPVAAQEPPARVRELLQMLADPEVQRWLDQQRVPARAASAPTAATAASASAPASPAAESMLQRRIDEMRADMRSVADAMPRVTTEVLQASRAMRTEMREVGAGSMLALLLGFAALGWGAERLLFFASGRVRRWIIGSSMDTPAERLRATLARMGFGTSMVLAFAIGTVGAFLLFDWPPLMREVLLAFLLALVAVRLAIVVGRFLLAPGAPKFRMVPMSTEAAWFWHYRLVVLVAWLAFTRAGIGWLVSQGIDAGVWRVLGNIASLVTLLLLLEAVWRRPGVRNDRWLGLSWGLSGAFVFMHVLRVIGAFDTFWLVAVGLALFGAVRLNQAIEAHMQRPPDDDPTRPVAPSVGSAIVARSFRLMLHVAAAWTLLVAWDIDLAVILEPTTLPLRLLRALIQIAIVVLLADLLWYVLRTVIERRLSEAVAVHMDDADAGRAMRLRTVLPIVRNMSLVIIATMAVLMGLSALGVDIGPLVAGAGVVGIAIGFGAQTLVKDVVSGIFYLLDDAFRIGEYIQSNAYKGTVEAFSLRSVKLRHHRGPLYTVPFGELGAVQNMSRDWVIDKLTVGVTYDSDLERARKLVKSIGQQLAADPEMGRHILEPLKMQGVEQFGDFAIQLRMKMMTRPGEQFVIRRKALAMIKQAFDANGIKFAYPTVQIAAGADPAAAAAAAAQQMLASQQPPAAG